MPYDAFAQAAFDTPQAVLVAVSRYANRAVKEDSATNAERVLFCLNHLITPTQAQDLGFASHEWATLEKRMREVLSRYLCHYKAERAAKLDLEFPPVPAPKISG